jgi:hypothetical protein
MDHILFSLVILCNYRLHLHARGVWADRSGSGKTRIISARPNTSIEGSSSTPGIGISISLRLRFLFSLRPCDCMINLSMEFVISELFLKGNRKLTTIYHSSQQFYNKLLRIFQIFYPSRTTQLQILNFVAFSL